MRILAALTCLVTSVVFAQDLSYEAAPALVRAGKFEEAIAALDKELAKAKGPERIAALYWRGQSQAALGARGKAIEDFPAARKESETAPVVGALGMQYALSGAAAQARPLLER